MDLDLLDEKEQEPDNGTMIIPLSQAFAAHDTAEMINLIGKACSYNYIVCF